MKKQPQAIIVLSGVSHAGKTTTLKKTIETLASSGCKRLDLNGDNIAKPKGDIRAAFDINGFRVGICTPGDTASVISENIKWALNQEIDILVTASKSAAKSDSVKTIIKQSVEWNVYPLFFALMTHNEDSNRDYQEIETSKRIVAAIRLKTFAL